MIGKWWISCKSNKYSCIQ